MASWDIGTWDGGTKTKLTFHLRSDILWQDVPAKADRTYDILPLGATGVPVTTKDVAFTVISIRDNLDAWNQFLVADVGKVEINDAVLGSSQMLRSYDNVPMDVYGLSTVPTQDVIVYYNLLSPWITLHWVGGLPILPYHIWYHVPWWDYDGDGTIDSWLYDPEIEKTLIGSGPYIFDHRTPGIEILLKAFNIGTVYDPPGTVSTGDYFQSLRRRAADFGGSVPPVFFKFDGKVDGKDLSLFLQVFKAQIRPAANYTQCDIGSGVPPKFFKFDTNVDGKDLSMFLQCFKEIAPWPISP
jgi:hypothetical protein